MSGERSSSGASISGAFCPGQSRGKGNRDALPNIGYKLWGRRGHSPGLVVVDRAGNLRALLDGQGVILDIAFDPGGPEHDQVTGADAADHPPVL